MVTRRAYGVDVQERGVGLANIVEQAGKTQLGDGGKVSEGLNTVGVYIVAVVGIMLQKAFGWGKLRHNLACELRKGQ